MHGHFWLVDLQLHLRDVVSRICSYTAASMSTIGRVLRFPGDTVLRIVSSPLHAAAFRA